MTLEDFFPYLMPQAKGLAEPVAEFNIRLAIIELCQKALIWREYQTAITTDGLATAFAYTPAAGQQVAKLLSLTLEGSDITVVAPDKGKRLDASGASDCYAYGGFSKFELRPLQVAGLDIITYSAVAPSITATTVPDKFGRYAELIGIGALWRVQTTAGRDYSNPAAAQFNKDRWDDCVNGAKTDAFIGFSRTAPRTSASWF